MPHSDRGLYEILITEALDEQLRTLEGGLEAQRPELHASEAADRIALHLSRIIQRVLADLPDESRVATGIAIARALIQQLPEEADVLPERPLEPGTVLRAILALRPDGNPETIHAPLIPLFDTTLLTNAPGEPNLRSQVVTEIESADRIDIVMAFIRRSGISPLLEALRMHRANGRPLRVLTTTYTGSTEASSLDNLTKIGAEVRVSYDTTTTRLHAKAWILHRQSGFSTAYIGSSNLTHSAQVTGLEWNVRVSGARNPDVVEKMSAVFESYWNNGDFVPYDAAEFLARTEQRGETGPRFMLNPIELRPEPFQERLLEQIALSRQQGHHRNLLVSATGTGKTVMAAVDYIRLRQQLPLNRLLFVAHRKEILEQSCATFRQGLRDYTFGEMWVDGNRPSRFDHVFASIQSLNADGLARLDPKHFDVIIVDEFHHAAAQSYITLLTHMQPVELLGLTATPERSDGLPILGWFDNRIAAELRLWNAIDQHRLCPFAYYGIHDGLDLRTVPWRRGSGYDVEGLSNLLTSNEIWARLVLTKLTEHIPDFLAMRALGFCVSVRHAQFMANVFQTAGIPSRAIWSNSSDDERSGALKDLAACRINIVFSVDLFNEGVDVPHVDTLLMLRPTDSPTLFLQQLGRGLRRVDGKSVCTVLDFVGHHRTEFRFDRRFRALLGGSRKELIEQIENGFPFLPAGCHLELDRVATEIVLRNIRNALPTRWNAKIEELRLLAQGEADISLERFLTDSGLELTDIYIGNKSWSDLKEAAGLPIAMSGPNEEVLRRAIGRLLHVDDIRRIDAYRGFLRYDIAPLPEVLPEVDRRLLRMLIASVVDRVADRNATLQEGCAILWAHPQIRAELLELLDVLADQINHVPYQLPSHSDVPLQIHAQYSRIEMFAAFGIGERAKVALWQTGVFWAEKEKSDLLAFTLDKTSGGFSPTTRYRDYAISRELIHWESQSTARADREPGLRYRHHVERGTNIMLFARLREDDRGFYFLGPARYVSHKSERPMAITWKLDYALPGDLFAAFAAAVA